MQANPLPLPPQKLSRRPTTDEQRLPSLEAVLQLPHRNYDRAQLVLFTGRRGFGKTVALRKFVSDLEPRVFILDPFEDFPEVRRRLSLSEAMEEMAQGKPLRRRVVPPIDHESRDFAERFFELAIEKLRDCLIVLDEITLHSDRMETQQLRTLILQGRRLGLRMAIAAQKIQFVPQVMLGEVTELVIFRTTRPRDTYVLSEWAGDSVAEEAKTLGVGECLLVKF